MSFFDPTQKQVRKEQKEFLKDKPFKYKLKYFFDYYLIDVAVIGVFAIIIGSLIYTSLSHKDVASEILFINSINEPDPSGFAEYLGIDDKKEEVIFDGSMYINIDGSDTTSYVNVQKWFALIAAGDVDVMIGDRTTMYHYGNSEFFTDLRDLFTKEELAALGDRVVWYDLEDGDGNKTGESAPYYIDITDSPYLNNNLIYMGAETYLTFAVNSKRPEVQRKFFEYITEGISLTP